MGEAVLDKVDRAGADSSARRPQQGHQHLDRRPLARPSRAGSPDKSPARTLQLASPPRPARTTSDWLTTRAAPDGTSADEVTTSR